MCAIAINDCCPGVSPDTTRPHDIATNHQPASSPLANHVDNYGQDANVGIVILTVMRSGVMVPRGEAAWLDSHMNQVYQTQMRN